VPFQATDAFQISAVVTLGGGMTTYKYRKTRQFMAASSDGREFSIAEWTGPGEAEGAVVFRLTADGKSVNCVSEGVCEIVEIRLIVHELPTV
jgi:hypothetical protein